MEETVQVKFLYSLRSVSYVSYVCMSFCRQLFMKFQSCFILRSMGLSKEDINAEHHS